LKFGGHPFPYLCCDVDHFDQDLIGWNDASRSYDYYNLIFEIPHKSLRRTEKIDVNTRNVDSIADAAGYAAALASSQAANAHRAGEDGTEVELKRKTPLYSIIRHYPTKWQMKLAEETKNSEA
jgi:hypothetical protein